MGEIVDFQKLLQDAKTGAAWPEGDYDFEVAEAEGVTSSNGSPMIKTKLRCLVGPYAGKTITNNFVMKLDSPGSLRMFFLHMQVFGLDDSFFTQLGQGDSSSILNPVAAQLRGKRARCTIGHREWPAGSGVLTNQVNAVKPITEGLAQGGVRVPQATGAPSVTTIPPAPQAVATVPPPPPAATTPAAVPPPPPPIPAPAAAAPSAPPVPSAPLVTPPPPPAPTAPASTDIASAAAAAAANGSEPPAGYSPEVWASIPDAAKAVIVASAAAAAAQQASAVPPPPTLPV